MIKVPEEKKIFGTDGVRGVANVEPVTAETALKLGRAAAHVFGMILDHPQHVGTKPLPVRGTTAIPRVIADECHPVFYLLRFFSEGCFQFLGFRFQETLPGIQEQNRSNGFRLHQTQSIERIADVAGRTLSSLLLLTAERAGIRPGDEDDQQDGDEALHNFTF